MKKRTYVISKKAVTDIEDIWLYTFRKWSLEQADRYYNLIFDEIEYICKNADAGKLMEHIRKGYRVSKVKSHLIFYRISTENKIEVIRVLHERMDIENRLSD
jgi:toxin ParE1/3/4